MMREGREPNCSLVRQGEGQERRGKGKERAAGCEAGRAGEGFGRRGEAEASSTNKEKEETGPTEYRMTARTINAN